MGVLHPEELRRCSLCGEQWIAEHYTRLDAQQPIIGQGFTRRSQDLARQTVHERRLNKHDRWRYCPACGTRKVKTVAKGAAARKALARQAQDQGATASSAGAPAAGWYRDPDGAPQLRYWDGTRWTESTAPKP
jgi:Protein of unknown function (DUF2510)